MRLALVSETYPPQINGVSRTLERLVQYLSARGDQILLLIPRYPSPPSSPPGVMRRDFPAVPLPFYKEVVLPFTTPGQIEGELKAFAPDLVHIATEGALGWAALKGARRLNLPTVSSYHSNFPHYLRLYGAGALEPIAWGWLRSFHNATRRTFCPTESIRQRLLQQGFRNVSTWGRGVDGDRFHPGRRSEELRRSWGAAPEDPVLLYAGRLAREKNLETLLNAWDRLSAHPARLVLVGDGPLRERLEHRGSRGVVFAGYQVGDALAAAYASADLMVFPSLSETFGNVLLEGMASGIPVVGFRAPGPQDLIRDGETGRLVDPAEEAPLAAVLKQTLADRSLLARMGRNARAHAESLSWGQILGELREEYQQILGQARVTAATVADPSA